MKIDVAQNLLGLDGEPMPIVFQPCPMCGRPMEENGPNHGRISSRGWDVGIRKKN